MSTLFELFGKVLDFFIGFIFDEGYDFGEMLWGWVLNVDF
jgi:hypothetical protein